MVKLIGFIAVLATVMVGSDSSTVLARGFRMGGGRHSGHSYSYRGHRSSYRSSRPSYGTRMHSPRSSIIHVRGYRKRNGTMVAPHYRTSADHTKQNNWSTKGNVNPMTGEKGTKNVE